jgi:hypothetical protein
MEHAEYTIVGMAQRRRFAIITGLSEAFGKRGVIHHYDEAAEVVREWIAEQGWSGEGYLPGTIQTGTYALGHGSGENVSAELEPAIVFSGNVSSYLSDRSDDEIKELLNDLALKLAKRLGQLRIEIEYCDETWALLPR